MAIPFQPLAHLLARLHYPKPQVDLSGLEALQAMQKAEDQQQGVLVTVNHYSAPDFKAWWMVILISALMPDEIHWVMTEGWTNSGWLTDFTHWLFPRVARILGFTAMPAMPPDPNQVEARASAIRAVLQYARETPQPVIGLAPEGGDTRGGVLGALPAGVGRFIHLLSQYCPTILPVGIWKEAGRICLKFGAPYSLELPDIVLAKERDLVAGQRIMEHIAALLPEHLSGDYIKKPEGK